MADRVAPGPVESPASIREAVCVNTRKIYDSCRDKDCVDDLRVYPTESSQAYIDSALSIRSRTADLLHVDVSDAPVSFNRGYYTVDCSYFYAVTGETFPAGQTVTGLCVFDKRVMLFGSVASVKSFCSEEAERRSAGELPIAVVSAVDPICLHCKIVDAEAVISGDCNHRAVQHPAPRTRHPAHRPGLRLQSAGEGVPGPCHGRSLHAVQPHRLPGRRVLPAGFHQRKRRLPQPALTGMC